ncbi:hypothetical protein Acr_16g0000770 [Actinidia rufa]|uniref:Uncharacterized protein n=1 Tax=Actinidia rufa TaxID=165716 RepID=A0A7J0FXP5_9ERIC|nr:hypothetical protein Acr_16g0000770 [Actinidia rufa]
MKGPIELKTLSLYHPSSLRFSSPVLVLPDSCPVSALGVEEACTASETSLNLTKVSCLSLYVSLSLNERTIIDVEDSLPSWVFDHLGVYHAMDPDVREDLVSPPMEEIVEPKDDSQLVEDAKPHLSIFGDYPRNVKGWKMKFFFVSGDDWEVAHGESREFEVLRLWSTPAQQMECSGRDNKGREVSAGDVAQVRANEVMSKKVDLKKLVNRAQAKAIVKVTTKTILPLTGVKDSKLRRVAIKESQANPRCCLGSFSVQKKDATSEDGGDKTTSVHLGVFLGLEALVIKNPATSKKLAQSFLIFIDKEMAGKMELDKVATQFYHACSQVNKFEHLGDVGRAQQETQKDKDRVAELTREREHFDLAIEKPEKEVANLKRKEDLTKKLAITKFKAFEETKDLYDLLENKGDKPAATKDEEALIEEVSTYYYEGFDLCKKQIKLGFPNIDIDDMQVDLDLAEEGDEDAVVDRDETAVQDQVSPIEGGKKGITLPGQF